MSIQKVIDFIESYKTKKGPNRQWVYLEAFKMNLYVRRSIRFFDNSKQCIDLASFEIEEEFRGKKLFTNFLKAIEIAAKDRLLCVFVECVQNERLAEYLARNGYKRVEQQSFFKEF